MHHHLSYSMGVTPQYLFTQQRRDALTNMNCIYFLPYRYLVWSLVNTSRGILTIYLLQRWTSALRSATTATTYASTPREVTSAAAARASSYSRTDGPVAVSTQTQDDKKLLIFEFWLKTTIKDCKQWMLRIL